MRCLFSFSPFHSDLAELSTSRRHPVFRVPPYAFFSFLFSLSEINIGEQEYIFNSDKPVAEMRQVFCVNPLDKI